MQDDQINKLPQHLPPPLIKHQKGHGAACPPPLPPKNDLTILAGKRLGNYNVSNISTGKVSEASLVVQDDAVCVTTLNDIPIRCTLGFRYGKTTVLIGTKGECVKLLSGSIEIIDGIMRYVKPHDHLIPLSNDEFLMIALDGSNTEDVLLCRIKDGDIFIGKHPVIRCADIVLFAVTPAAPGFKRMQITGNTPEGRVNVSLIAPESVAHLAWGKCESRREDLITTRKQNMASLYKEYNSLIKDDFLFVLYGDLIFLGFQMNEGIGLQNLMRQLETKGGVEFAENKVLRETTIAKVIVLTEGIKRIKQKFELLASMYPYYWAQREAKWLTSVFSQKLPPCALATERKRLIPRIRQHIRTVQSSLLRALSEIESGSRHIDSIMAREEIRKHWSSQGMRYGPAIIQGGLALSMLAVPGGTSIGLRILGGMVGAQAVSTVFGHFQQDKEAAAQVQRAALAIFPWWEVFNYTLAVSMFETGEFTDNESTIAMKRDHDLFDQLKPDDQLTMRGILRERLYNKIIEGRENRLKGVIEGSDIRLIDILHQVQVTAGSELQSNLRSFAARMVSGANKSV